MNKENNSFGQGVRDGVPIGVGYLAVGFAYGLSAVLAGLSPLEALLISLLNLTSAGQLAGTPIIAAGGSFVELATSQLVINSRYSLMSVSMSQKFDSSVGFADRFLIGFGNTDEVYAVAMAKEGSLGRRYMLGLIIPPIVGWCSGTLLGAVAGDILPAIIVTALSVSMYAMFIAILVPAARGSIPVLLCILSAVALSTVFYFVPVLSAVPSGFVIIIIAVAVSALFALLCPLKEGEEGTPCEENGGSTEKEVAE